MTTTYSITGLTIDQHGVRRDTGVRDCTAADAARLGLADCDFQGAADLADGVTFADTIDSAGRLVRVYREVH